MGGQVGAGDDILDSVEGAAAAILDHLHHRIGAGAAIGATSYYRTRKAKKRGDTGAFVDNENDTVNRDVTAIDSDESLRGSEIERKSPAKASGSKPRAPEVPQAA